KVILSSSTVATVPATQEVHRRLANKTYDTYKDGDFARLSVQLTNELRQTSQGPISLVSLEIEPERVSDASDRATIAPKEPLRVEVLAAHEANGILTVAPKWGFAFEAGEIKKVLGSYTAKYLKFTSVRVAIWSEESKTTFATLPARILLPE